MSSRIIWPAIYRSGVLPLVCVALLAGGATSAESRREFRETLPAPWRELSPLDGGPWTVEPWLLDGLRTMAAGSRERIVGVHCVETVTRVQPDAGRSRARTLAPTGYALQPDLGEHRTREGRPVRETRAARRHPQPAPGAWLLLFDEEHRDRILFGQREEWLEGFDRIVRIRFRGSEPFSDGRSIRQWEGEVLVDRDDFTILEVVAQPRDQDALLQARLDRRRKKLRFVIGDASGPTLRAGSRVRVRRTVVRFDTELDGLSLPSESRSEVRIVDGDWSYRPQESLIREFAGWAARETPPDRGGS